MMHLDLFNIYNFATSHCTRSLFGIESWNKYLNQATGLYDEKCNLTNNFSLETHGWLIAAGILDILIRVAGLLAVIFIISGGFKYITSAGSPDKTSSALKTIINSLTGLVIAIIASTGVSFIVGRLANGGTFGSGGGTEASALGNAFTIVYGVAGMAAALMVVVGGFKLVTSTGEPQKISAARNTIIYSLVGLVIVLIASVITSFVLGYF